MKHLSSFKCGTVLCGLILSAASAFSQGTAFTYQGRLYDGANPANGKYDLRFSLYDALSVGSLVAGPTTNSAVVVSNGLFTVALDFGAGVFTGPARFLEIGARSNTVAVAFTVLSPRQQLTPTPYAITAENVDGLVSASQLTGTLGLSLFPVPLNLSGSTVPPLFEVDQNGSGIGIYGVHTSAAGTSAGVEGSTASTAGSAVGVYGLVSATSPGGFSAAVRGENKGTGGNGIGIYGSQAGSGWGGYLTSVSGFGLNADGGSGTGVYASGATGVFALGSTGDGVDGQSSSAIGVSGTHSGATGTAAGVQGSTASTDSSANAIYGVVSSTSPGGFSAAVRGQNNGTGGGGIGVWGSQNGSGWGGYFTSASGIGLLASGGSGTGVSASGATGVYASSGSGSALTIGSGAIHVSGAGTNTSTAAFIQVATAANTSSYITTIHNPLCDGDPNAILIATHNFSPTGVTGNYETHPHSVWYNGSNWTIYHDDFTAILGMSFNVLIIKN